MACFDVHLYKGDPVQMTTLTLTWHLKTIVNGVAPTDDSDWYGDLPAHRSDHYDRQIAADALHSDDPVAFLDSVAHDPSRSYQQRHDAAELLELHVLERRLLHLTSFPSVRTISDDGYSEWVESNLSTNSGPGFWSTVECPNCGEGEVLYNWDDDCPECHCGESMLLPAYP